MLGKWCNNCDKYTRHILQPDGKWTCKSCIIDERRSSMNRGLRNAIKRVEEYKDEELDDDLQEN